MKLLLIDDDEIDRMMVERLLRSSGKQIEITQANTGLKGTKLFAEDTFDAVLLDFHLPDVNGFELLHSFQHHPERRAAIIILTGGSNEELELKCIEAGAQDFLLKSEVSAHHLRRALLHARIRHRLESKIHESHEALRSVAENDPLTGIANRYFFDRNLHAALAPNALGPSNIAIIILDIDNFKLVNDSMGHHIGDVLLRDVARRLTKLIRAGDILCRLGGDEFAVIAANVSCKEDAIKLADRIQAALKSPFQVENHEFSISFSIGISLTSGSDVTADELFKFADLALYQAKRDGKNCYHLFSDSLQVEAYRKASIEKDLRSPQLLDQLEVFYQPMIDATSRRICGAEALIRWNHPTRGRLAPGAFLDVAEEFGLMRMLDAWSSQAACHQMANWLSRGLVTEEFRITFNICAATLKQSNLPREIHNIITTSGVPPHCVEIEVTETDLVADFQQSAAILNEIRSFGVGVAVDDFGTGYSSLAYLKRLPSSTLKIDRIFLMNVPEGDIDRRILRAMIIMAKSIGLRVVVEGIESAGQTDLCIHYGADVLQGFHFSKPLPVAEFEASLAAASAWRPAAEAAQARHQS